MNKDFRDLLQSLLGAEARFLVVGAYALAAHGWPRATGDLDIWVEPTPENAPRVYQALRDFGAPLGDLTVSDLTTSGVVFQIGVVPRRIDILTAIDGVAFAEAWANRIESKMGNLAAPVIGREDFLCNKRASGRAKDLADAEALEGGIKPTS